MDTETVAQIEARLTPLTRDDRPFSVFALEALAMARLQNGQVAPAREALVLLKNGLDTPDVVSQRADLSIAAIDSGSAADLKKIVEAQRNLPVAPARPAGAVQSAAPAPAAPASAPARP